MRKYLLLFQLLFISMVTFAQEISFTDDYIFANENDGTVTIELELSDTLLTNASVEISLYGDFATAFAGTDFTFSDFTFVIPSNSAGILSFDIPLTDNGISNIDKLFVLKLDNAVNCKTGDITEFVVYLLDNEDDTPVASRKLQIEFAASYLVDEEGSAEIVAYNAGVQRLYVVNSTATKLEILDFSNPKSITDLASIDMTAYGEGATSVATDKNLVAATVAGPEGENGKVVFMDLDGNVLKIVEAGNLPDMVTFSKNGKYALIANEGEPSGDYSIDPEGSITLINVSRGVKRLRNSDIAHIDFHDFNSEIDRLKEEGIRIFGYNASVSQDVEPEYITISADNKKAWVSLQENNAMAEIDLKTKKILKIWPLGTKDHSLPENSLDASDRNDSIFMSTWNVKGLYMPDAIASYKVKGVTYVVTANEGDQREFGPINEDVSIKDKEYELDPDVFPNAKLLKENYLLGRLAVTPYSGDLDGDGDFDEIHIFGSRSFSIWNTKTGEQVYDSGNDFEKITAADPVFGSLFNASNGNNTFKNRSDNKGPEPEGITIEKINGRYYAFITLERTGGFMVYDISNPEKAQFVDYQNNRALGEDEGGDLGPEGIICINEFESPVDTAMIVMANEISSTISVYYITSAVCEHRRENNIKQNHKSGDVADEFILSDVQVYPNPANTNKVFFSEPVSLKVYNLSGTLIESIENAVSLDISNYENGIYFLKTTNAQNIKLIISK